MTSNVGIPLLEVMMTDIGKLLLYSYLHLLCSDDDDVWKCPLVLPFNLWWWPVSFYHYPSDICIPLLFCYSIVSVRACVFNLLKYWYCWCVFLWPAVLKWLFSVSAVRYSTIAKRRRGSSLLTIRTIRDGIPSGWNGDLVAVRRYCYSGIDWLWLYWCHWYLLLMMTIPLPQVLLMPYLFIGSDPDEMLFYTTLNLFSIYEAGDLFVCDTLKLKYWWYHSLSWYCCWPCCYSWPCEGIISIL